jgi:hypothetical protein
MAGQSDDMLLAVCNAPMKPDRDEANPSWHIFDSSWTGIPQAAKGLIMEHSPVLLAATGETGQASFGHVKRLAAGIALVMAAPLSVASWVLVPHSMVQGDEFVSEIALMSSERMWASMVTGALFFPFAIIAVLGLLHLMAGRTLVGLVGAGLAVVGLSLNLAAIGAAGTLAEAVYAGHDRTETASLVELTMGGTTGAIAGLGVLLGTVGTTLLGIGLYKVRAMPRLLALLLAIYGPLQAVGFGTEFVPLITLSYAVMALAMIPIGLLIMLGSVANWNDPPSYGGFNKKHASRGEGVSTV